MDGILIQGWVHWNLRQNGHIIQSGLGKNTITTLGKEWVAQRISSTGAAAPLIGRIMGGDDATPPNESQSALIGSTVFSVPTATIGGLKGTAPTVRNWVFWDAEVDNTVSEITIREIGIFDVAVPTIMLARFLPVTITMPVPSILGISWRLIVGGTP